MWTDPRYKIKSLEELKAIVTELHARGRTITFANGCFDLIHVGHIRYLQSAKALGDVLLLGINSDAGVAALKGKGRPLQSAEDRLEILASLECVDYVFVFDDLTVDGILKMLRPDIHAKGTDYSQDTVPERETVNSYGGRVAIVGDSKEHSTRDLIQAILSKFIS